VDTEAGGLHPSIQDVDPDEEALRILHKTIKKVTDDTETMNFNTAISAMIIFVNQILNRPVKPKSVIEQFILLVSPYAPHVAEELWQRLGHERTLAYEPWPQLDEALARDEQIEVPIQVNGKLRSKMMVPADVEEEQLKQQALADEKIKALVEGKEIRKVIVAKKRLVNIVTS